MEKAVDVSSPLQEYVANADHDSDSASSSPYASLSAKSSSSYKSAENIEVKADFSSCTDSDGPEWESGVLGTQNTEDDRQNKERRGHLNANGTLISRDIPLSPLPQEKKKKKKKKKKMKMKHISESGSQKYGRIDTLKEESSASQTSLASRRKLAQHECMFCNKRFRDRYHLVRHLSVHSGETAPDCKLCKMPRNCCRCVPHSPQYSPIKQHRCDICSKMFRDKYHLNRHSLVHTKEKPHQCKVCQKPFSRKDKLMQHSLLHD